LLQLEISLDTLYITPACDMAPEIVIEIPFVVGIMPLAGVPFQEPDHNSVKY
jgi:hypothetical protein